MAKSMTGFGRAQAVVNGRSILFEIKSVNHRYFEYASRLPRNFSYLDENIKTLLKSRLVRGKVEVNLYVQNVSANDALVTVNDDVAQSYLAAFSQMAQKYELKNDITVSTLAALEDIFVVAKAQIDEQAIWHDFEGVLAQALSGYDGMRIAEGEKLKLDIFEKLTFLKDAVDVLEKSSEKRVKKYMLKLHERLQNLLEATDIDEQRILTEAAIFADKTAVDEETVRLKSHFAQFETILNSGEPAGKKLDFLTQELNREVNTIGSKTQDVEVTRLVVDMKAEIEKIREQIQNIE